MREGVTIFIADTDNCCVVRHVPCLQCDACGEIAYTVDVAEQLESIVKSAKQALTEVAVVNYPGAVA